MTAKEVLDQILLHEQKLESFYRLIRDNSKDNSLRLLAYFLRRHCNNLTGTMSECIANSVDELADTEIPHSGETLNSTMAFIDDGHSKLDAACLMQHVLKYELRIQDIYKSIAELSKSKKVKQLVAEVLAKHRKNVSMLKKMMATRFG